MFVARCPYKPKQRCDASQDEPAPGSAWGIPAPHHRPPHGVPCKAIHAINAMVAPMLMWVIQRNTLCVEFMCFSVSDECGLLVNFKLKRRRKRTQAHGRQPCARIKSMLGEVGRCSRLVRASSQWFRNVCDARIRLETIKQCWCFGPPHKHRRKKWRVLL